MPVACLFTVKGRVQGVFFRASTRRVADSLGLTGYAINLPDGNVEVLACGDGRAVDELAAWLYRGPERARVDTVERRIVDVAVPDRFTTG